MLLFNTEIRKCVIVRCQPAEIELCWLPTAQFQLISWIKRVHSISLLRAQIVQRSFSTSLMMSLNLLCSIHLFSATYSNLGHGGKHSLGPPHKCALQGLLLVGHYQKTSNERCSDNLSRKLILAGCIQSIIPAVTFQSAEPYSRKRLE